MSIENIIPTYSRKINSAIQKHFDPLKAKFDMIEQVKLNGSLIGILDLPTKTLYVYTH